MNTIELHCEQTCNCTSEVTHIGNKGYIYCQRHAIERRQSGHENTRKLRPYEVKKLRRGEPVAKY